jgi:hypothetical protein
MRLEDGQMAGMVSWSFKAGRLICSGCISSYRCIAASGSKVAVRMLLCKYDVLKRQAVWRKLIDSG